MIDDKKKDLHQDIDNGKTVYLCINKIPTEINVENATKFLKNIHFRVVKNAYGMYEDKTKSLEEREL